MYFELDPSSHNKASQGKPVCGDIHLILRLYYSCQGKNAGA